ncbi:MAG: hypothetical protein MUE63_11300 [Xanthomonadales bacterium]|nr:hypothetical protein [Xanthomonadales bacterium]
MLTLLENADIYAPEPLGIGCLLVGGGKLLYLGPERPALDARLLGETLDLAGMPVIPGLIDAHVHATGGGGEDGFSTQAPPVPLSGFTRHGVTTVVGLLGTDDETRGTAGLLARWSGCWAPTTRRAAPPGCWPAPAPCARRVCPPGAGPAATTCRRPP